MLNNEEIEILELEPPIKEYKKEEKTNTVEVQKKSKIVPFFLVCVFILIVTQIIVFTMITINNI